METLQVTWTDPRGKDWDLTSGAQGVVLDLGQQGLGWAELSHTYGRGGNQRQASHVTRGKHHFKVLVGSGRRGQSFYDLSTEWWQHANSYHQTGRLTITQPNGTQRYRDLHLADSPDTEYHMDPGMGLQDVVELWSLTGDSPWWYGPEQVKKYTATDFSGGNSTPFYGPSGAGWPLYISSGATAAGATIDNEGTGPMWLTWTLVGPMSNPRVGVAGRVLTYEGDIPAGETVVITTDITNRTVVEASTQQNRYGSVSGMYAPVPRGTSIPLQISAEGMGSSSAIYVSGSPAYATAF